MLTASVYGPGTFFKATPPPAYFGGKGQGRAAALRCLRAMMPGKRIFSSNSKALLTWRLAVLLSIMNTKQRKTLEAIFASPTPKTLPFSEMESLFRAIGCEVIEGDGSRVAFRLSGARVAFHRPHPRKEAQEYQVRAARDFFEALGIRPEIGI